MRFTKAWILAVALSLPIAAATAEPAKASTSVSLSFFYDSLSHQGDWFVNANYGYVWRPYGVSASWRPYSDGRWVYSDYGWTFASYSDWGWAAYHYGRWTYDPYYGWVWVPGSEWGPAWVSFYSGPGWIGWAPLPPRVSYTASIRYDPRAFCFVESRYFLDSNVGRRIAPISYNTRLVRSTRDISRFSRQRNAVVNVGLAVDHVEKATRSRVRRYHVNERTDVRQVSRTQIRGDALEVFRPNVTARATHPPKVKEDRTKRAVAKEHGRSAQIERSAAPVQVQSKSKVELQSKSKVAVKSKSRVELQTKSKERKAQPAQKPPTAVRSESRSSARVTTSRAAERATYDASRRSAATARSSYRPARVEREPRSSARVSSKATAHGRDEARAKVTSRSVAPTRDSGAAQKAAALERAKADQAKAAAAAKAKESPKKSQRSTRKPSSHEHKPPHG